MDNFINEFLSLSNFRQAWYKVADNKGCAGIDKQTIEIFAMNEEVNLINLRDAVANNTYAAQPLQQMLIPKEQNDFRELRIPTVKDRIVQQALLNVLYPITESIFSDSSFGYRPNRSYQDAVKRVAYWRDQGYKWVLDGDIEKFFDNLSHNRLLIEFRKIVDNSGILCLVKSWISAKIITNKETIASEKGIPQGAVISPILANIYLHEFDQYFDKSNFKLVRYADDFLVLSDSKDGIMSAYTQVVQLLDYIGLKLNDQKSRITNFERGFQFLGHGFLYQAIFPMDDESKNNRKKKFSQHRYQRQQKRKNLCR